ncbi:MAG: hypothetical protein KDB57_04430 [Solirubrobacterales bacterium]|nr:hypothetical protein [Solirubrobacterales bacterium]
MKALPEAQPEPGEVEYLEELLKFRPPGPDEAIREAIREPFDPALALGRSDAARLLDPAPMELETGWSVLPDASVQVAVATPMPDLTTQMVDWWFDWHPRRSDRYRAWHPIAHFGNGLVLPRAEQEKPYWGATNLVDEDIGDGRMKVRVEFCAPGEFGFGSDCLDDPAVGTIICASVGDSLVNHTDMAHVFLREDDGLMLRSRFWIGGRIEPRLPGPFSGLEGPAGSLLSRRPVRRLAIPGGMGPGLARHCAEEYANLNRILPGLFERFNR